MVYNSVFLDKYKASKKRGDFKSNYLRLHIFNLTIEGIERVLEKAFPCLPACACEYSNKLIANDVHIC